ncbi:hypothetical protein [Endozoicomonas sp. Mp262]|uniref:hypothetical protein n=1 Tax=Endozoicomonas sp. Mp262 TaxID=2919499 RepID=UPI0021DB6DEC
MNISFTAFAILDSACQNARLPDSDKISNNQPLNTAPETENIYKKIVPSSPSIRQWKNKETLLPPIDWLARTMTLADKTKHCYLCKESLPNCLCYCPICEQHIHPRYQNQLSVTCSCHTQGPSSFQCSDRLPVPLPKNICTTCLAYKSPHSKNHSCVLIVTVPQEPSPCLAMPAEDTSQYPTITSPEADSDAQNDNLDNIPVDILRDDLYLSDDSNSSHENYMDTFLEHLLNNSGTQKKLTRFHQKVLRYIDFLDRKKYDHLTASEWITRVQQSKIAFTQPTVYFLYPSSDILPHKLDPDCFFIRFCGKVDDGGIYVEQGILIITGNQKVYFIILNSHNIPTPYELDRNGLIQVLNRIAKHIHPKKNHFICAIRVNPPEKDQLATAISELDNNRGNLPKTVENAIEREAREEDPPQNYNTKDNYYFSIRKEVVQWINKTLHPYRSDSKTINGFSYESSIQTMARILNLKKLLTPAFLQALATVNLLKADTNNNTAPFRLFVLMSINPWFPPILTGYSFYNKSTFYRTEHLEETCVILNLHNNLSSEEYNYFTLSFDELSQHIKGFTHYIRLERGIEMELFWYYLAPFNEDSISIQ